MSEVVVERRAYRLAVGAGGLGATLTSPAGERWASLSLLAAVDRVDAVDETLAVEPPRVEGGALVVERRSTLWRRAGVTVVCGDDQLELRAWVAGDGALGAVHLLGGRSLLAGAPTGFLPSGSSFRTLFSPNPGDPVELVRPASAAAVIGVSGDGTPGRGHWFSTPAPLYLALTTDEVGDPEAPAAGGWLGLGIAAPVDELGFVQLAYRPGDRSFHLLLDYEGHTSVDGDFRSPALVLTPGVTDPYDGLRRHRDDLVARRAAPPVRPRRRPDWWHEPMFCGWGAQCHLARTRGGRAQDFATQAAYDAFLDALAREGVVPGTVVVDDKWQDAYGTNAPDPRKWPDLRGWIAARHERGGRVLLWWKAWDPEGLPAELCVRTPEGAPVVVDPTSPPAREALRRVVRGMLAPEGLDADGLKVDFTGRTPSGHALRTAGPGWGIALLHELLALVHDAAKEAKEDALLITQTPHPGFVDVTDMLRLNDMLRLDDVPRAGVQAAVVPQMRLRAAVARAACPELLVDTDDWCVPDRRTWREYLELKPELGVPSLYYATHLDLTGEPLGADDYEALRTTWARWRERSRSREEVHA
ncbi:MAG TPA: hypothetical protein VK874_04630 [Gaiellaceae bacterium]|nr:hypothetical protein [Gaiellaceae bacterium]